MSYLYEAAPSDAYIQNDPNNIRPSVFNETKKNKYRNCYKSKWANLKFFLQDKTSLEASVNLLKTKTVEQFSTKCKEIYTKKIEIQLSSERNRKLLWQGTIAEGYEDIISQIEVTEGMSGLPSEEIPNFLFIFRENNDLMLKLIDTIDNKKMDVLVPFLCHFFYENFYMESTEQEEIIYIIYLLLEKEIDQLSTPSELTFLDDSFIAQFLKEMGSRYEIKNYLDIILNQLIFDLEETNSNFYSLEVSKNVRNLKNDDSYDINDKGELISRYDLGDKLLLRPTRSDKNDKIFYNKAFTKTLSENISYGDNNLLINSLPEDVATRCSMKNLLELLNVEKNELIKQFLSKQIKKILFRDDPDLYDPYQIHEYLKKKKKVSKESLEEYNKAFEVITKFIDNLLSNLENDTIVPYSIKVICRFIYILIQKKFKTITKLEVNNFVGRFLFDKLILQILANPDRSDAGKYKMITLNTRKNLINIYTVFKYLVRGELFDADRNINTTVFNKFIIKNYYRVNKIIENMIDVKIPDKLKKLSDQFYASEDFVLSELKREPKEINYDYFNENPNDFLQHKSICFTINELNIFFDVVNAHQNLFLEPGKPLEKTFDNLSTFITMTKKNPNHYYVIIKDNYNDEAKKLLFHKEKTMPLGKAKSTEEIIQNLHYCISYLIGNLEILPHWDWVIENYKTMDTFEYINQYLNSYEGIYNFCPGSVPLNWYSLYILNNLNSIKPEDAINDYQPLYDDIETQIRTQLKKLSKLNEFLTVNMTTKFLLIDHKIQIFQEELENVHNSFVNLKALQFMQSTEINVSFASIEDMSKYKIPTEGSKYIGASPKILILQSETGNKNEKNLNKKKDKEEINPKINILCYNVIQFINKFTDYHKSIYEDIKNFSISKKKGEMETKIETKAKSVLDKYIELIDYYFNEEKIFEKSTTKNNEDDTNVLNDNNNYENKKTYKKKALKSIYNFALKTLGIKLYNEPIIKEDKDFYEKCKSLSGIKPEELSIKTELYDESIYGQIIQHIKITDNLRTPEEILNELGLALQLINSLYIFMLDKSEGVDSNEILTILPYILIKAKPKRLIFNLKFIEFFFDESAQKGPDYFTIITFHNSIYYIQEIKKEIKEVKIKEDTNGFEILEKDDAAPTPY